MAEGKGEWLMKKTGILLMFLLLFVLSGCDGKKNIREKVIKVPEFSSINIIDGKMVPNNDFGWKISVDEFLSKIYGSKVLDPDSETFDEGRYWYSEEQGVTTITPPIVYRIKGTEVDADVTYVFNEEGLYRIFYAWNFKNSIDGAQDCATFIAESLNANPYLVPVVYEKPDFLQLNEESLIYRWELKDFSNQYIDMVMRQFRDYSLISITVNGF